MTPAMLDPGLLYFAYGCLMDPDLLASLLEVELAPGCRHVPELYDACARRQGPIDLAAFLTTLATAVARRWLTMAPAGRS